MITMLFFYFWICSFLSIFCIFILGYSFCVFLFVLCVNQKSRAQKKLLVQSVDPAGQKCLECVSQPLLRYLGLCNSYVHIFFYYITIY